MRMFPRALVLICCGLFCLLPAAVAAEAPSLSLSTVPAGQEEATAILTIVQIGRYAIEADSQQPCQLSIIDRMKGELQSQNGRLELFLEPGEYQVRLGKAAADAVKLSVTQFTVLNGNPDFSGVAGLPADGAFSGKLRDREILAWWLHVDAAPNSKSEIMIEASGRSLGGIAVWRDGMWDTGLSPQRSNYSAVANQPLRLADVRGSLEAGNYLVLCWGAPKEKWGDNSGDEPFWLRSDLPKIGGFGLGERVIGPSGLDEFLAGGDCYAARLESPDCKALSMWFAGIGNSGNRLNASQNSALGKNTFIEADTGISGQKILLVKGPPGSKYRLSYAGRSWNGQNYRISVDRYAGSFLVSSMLLATPADDSGLSWLGVRFGKGAGQAEAGLETLPVISATNGFRQKINNIDGNSYLLRIQDNLELRVREGSADVSASYTFTPFIDSLGGKVAQALEITSNRNFNLAAGVYLLKLKPLKRGILDFTLSASSNAKAVPTPGIRGASAVVQASARNRELQFFLQNTAGNAVSFSQRSLPADPVDPLGFWLANNQSLDIPLELTQASTLRLEGGPCSMTIDGAAWKPEQVLPAGRYLAHIVGSSASPSFTLLAGQAKVDKPIPLKPQVDPELASLDAKAMAWNDIGANQALRYLLRVDQAGLYRLETEGRLFTRLTLRGQLAVSLYDAQSPHDQPNAILEAYLNPGLYQVVVQSLGPSSGHFGLRLKALETQTLPALRDGAISRTLVAAGTALSIPIQVASPGDYQLRTLSLGRHFRTRLEDSRGFPVTADSQSGEFSPRLAAGGYRYLSYPAELQTRRLVSLDLAKPSTAASSDQSSIIRFNQGMERVWRELPDRPETILTGSTPAAITGLLLVSEGMSYVLTSRADGSILAEGSNGTTGTQVKIPAGDFSLALRSLEDNDNFRYGIALFALEMLPGETRHYESPDNQLAISVGQDGFYELWSQGDSEMEAVLYSYEDGKIGAPIARSSAIENDWNFSLLAYLKKGVYVLATQALGQAAPMAAPASRHEAAQQSDDGEGGGGTEYESEGQAQSSSEGEGDSDGGDYHDSEEESPSHQSPNLDNGTLNLIRQLQGNTGPIAIQLLARPQKDLQWSAQDLAKPATLSLASEVINAAFTASQSGPFRIDFQSPAQIRIELLGSQGLIASGTNSLAVVLRDKSAYTLRYWKIGSETIELQLKIQPLASSAFVQKSVVKGQTLSLAPDGRRWRVAGAFDQEFVSVAEGEAFASGDAQIWLIPESGDLANSSPEAVQLSGNGSLNIRLLGENATVPLEIPDRQVALVSASGQDFLAGVALGALGAKTGTNFNWAGLALQDRGGQRLVAAGKYQATVWSAEPGKPSTSLSLACETFTLIKSDLLPKSGGRFSLAPHSALLFINDSGAQGARVILDEGLVAANNGSNPVFLDARLAPRQGTLGSGTIVVANPGSLELMLSIEAIPIQYAAIVDAGHDYESLLTESAELNLQVPGPAAEGKRIRLAGAIEAAWLYSESDGKRYAAIEEDSAVGSLWSLPCRKGRLVIQAGSGALRVWLDGDGGLAEDFYGKLESPAAASLAKLGASELAAAAQLWKFKVDADATILVQVEAPGLAAIVNAKGQTLRAAWSERRQSLVIALPKGDYAVKTRPFRDSLRGGFVRVQVLNPINLMADGLAEPRMIAPGDAQLYQFKLQSKGQVGIGVHSRSENLRVSLLDASGRVVDSGGLFIRNLPAGMGFLLVECLEQAQSYQALIYGLDGNNLGVPAEIQAQYRSQAAGDEE